MMEVNCHIFHDLFLKIEKDYILQEIVVGLLLIRMIVIFVNALILITLCLILLTGSHVNHLVVQLNK